MYNGHAYPSPNFKVDKDFTPPGWEPTVTSAYLDEVFKGFRKHEPQIDRKETEESVSVKIVAVESARENFDVVIKEGLLIVTHKVNKETALTKNFVQKYSLTGGILKLGSATASYKDGVLTVEIPKKEPKQISVE